jgi:hypothetical protein
MRFHKWRTWLQFASLISSQWTHFYFLIWEKAQLFINTTLKQHRVIDYFATQIMRRHAKLKYISCMEQCAIWVNTVHSTTYSTFYLPCWKHLLQKPQFQIRSCGDQPLPALYGRRHGKFREKLNLWASHYLQQVSIRTYTGKLCSQLR